MSATNKKVCLGEHCSLCRGQGWRGTTLLIGMLFVTFTSVENMLLAADVQLGRFCFFRLGFAECLSVCVCVWRKDFHNKSCLIGESVSLLGTRSEVLNWFWPKISSRYSHCFFIVDVDVLLIIMPNAELGR